MESSSTISRRSICALAREVASLDVLSEGRVVFGAGLGNQPGAEFEAFGEDPTPTVRRTSASTCRSACSPTGARSSRRTIL